MKVIYYAISFFMLVISAASTLSGLFKVSWVFKRSVNNIGLFRICYDKLGVQECQRFPNQGTCDELGEAFCTVWSSAGYTIQLSFIFLVPCLCAITLIACIGRKGGKKRREGWRLMTCLMVLYSSLQLFTVITVAVFSKTKNLGHLGTGFYMTLVAVLLSFTACFIQIIAGFSASRNYAWAKEEKDYWFTGRRSSSLTADEHTPLISHG
ncbi:hypothetical protein E3P92_03479 [Wallemia ichthyophaga]|uniref:SUR7 family protein pun1 n=2 Tax=Wallemia ichthyophaga TaxID=245174 RepID=A0A4T0FLL7_WALIC|nr:uncharacterized protein J056_000927 [Wallemia ichthyophaga EXF-994]TIA71920.1 hypothetical protein E3P91_02269 [Wallemia ichthyophaga]EOR00389.1 hypothetical protein J056_000927 [Wallemia ichthyophaga EXF-994]TIA84555.1 hypothetical protein E3P98_00176 [Wallemia ichthyophaga]TIA88615.1 hypothetical protein E3P97_03426 [Wallemia ichthyophaga]TIB05194.1 hypothetical protein E3P96_01360 [Wallemia ichthyophaga]